MSVIDWIATRWYRHGRMTYGSGTIDIFYSRITDRVVRVNIYGMEEWMVRNMLRKVDSENKLKGRVHLYP